MAKKKQITITLPNKVGELAKIAKKLAQHKVNIEALSVTNLLDVGVVRLIPSNLKQAKAALSDLNASLSIDDVVAVALQDQVGALADAAAKLKRAKVNIEYVYGSTCSDCNCSCNCQAVCIFKTSDLDETDKILAK
ncbi:MAG: amino acid-binding protein [Candidatus Omnitrophica bacterium]|nr:amino acid-binding protein [Candidatus Omnitrophota bacterium]